MDCIPEFKKEKKRKVSKDVVLLKKLLKYGFPECAFSVRIRYPYSYLNSSDRLIVDVIHKAGVTKDQILNFIRENTCNIKVGWQGQYMTILTRTIPSILNVDTGEYERVDAEFVEMQV